MTFTLTDIPGVVCIDPLVHGDERGFFFETMRANVFEAQGIPGTFVQENTSRSRKGILRGLHIQHPFGQGKLVRAVRGSVFDVAVDMREGSPSFGAWYGCELSEENRRQLWIPAGCAHGFYVTSDIADIVYKCTEYYHPESEFAVRWDDPDIGIGWPLFGAPVLSEKDRNALRLSDISDIPSFHGPFTA